MSYFESFISSGQFLSMVIDSKLLVCVMGQQKPTILSPFVSALYSRILSTLQSCTSLNFSIRYWTFEDTIKPDYKKNNWTFYSAGNNKLK